MKKAFSLIELSIVLLIIGIIIAGVTQSSSLLQKAKIQSSQTLTKNSPVAGIEGLLMWFEPTLPESFLSSEAEEGQVITQWNDINPQSSSKLYMTSFGSIHQFYKNVSGPGGLPSIYFDESNAAALRLCYNVGSNVDAFIKTPTQTFFIVFKLNPSASFSYFEENFAELLLEYEDQYYYYNRGGAIYSDDEHVSANSEIVSAIEEENEFKLYINGSNVITGVVSEWGNGASIFDGKKFYISEFIRYDHVLKNEERQSIEQYLGKKYGIAVAN